MIDKKVSFEKAPAFKLKVTGNITIMHYCFFGIFLSPQTCLSADRRHKSFTGMSCVWFEASVHRGGRNYTKARL